MAAVELSKPNSGCKSKFLYELNACVEKASDCLLLKDFQGCETTSKYGISRAKQFVEEEKACQCMESLCILCIQAMAELNRWPEVLPFIQDVFTSIELCPATVVQICILLLTKVREYTQCHAIASLWLKSEDNSYKVGYDRVACLYIAHVMLPRGQIPLVQQFLNSCTHLSEPVKNNICQKSEELVESMRVETEEKKVITDCDNTVYTDTDNCTHLDHQNTSQNTDDDSITKYIRSICCMLVNKLTFPSVDILWKLAAALVGILIVIKLFTKGNLKDEIGKATVIWQHAITMLKAIFTPYKPGR